MHLFQIVNGFLKSTPERHEIREILGRRSAGRAPHSSLSRLLQHFVVVQIFTCAVIPSENFQLRKSYHLKEKVIKKNVNNLLKATFEEKPTSDKNCILWSYLQHCRLWHTLGTFSLNDMRDRGRLWSDPVQTQLARCNDDIGHTWKWKCWKMSNFFIFQCLRNK